MIFLELNVCVIHPSQGLTPKHAGPNPTPKPSQYCLHARRRSVQHALDPKTDPPHASDLLRMAPRYREGGALGPAGRVTRTEFTTSPLNRQPLKWSLTDQTERL